MLRSLSILKASLTAIIMELKRILELEREYQQEEKNVWDFKWRVDLV